MERPVFATGARERMPDCSTRGKAGNPLAAILPTPAPSVPISALSAAMRPCVTPTEFDLASPPETLPAIQVGRGSWPPASALSMRPIAAFNPGGSFSSASASFVRSSVAPSALNWSIRAFEDGIRLVFDGEHSADFASRNHFHFPSFEFAPTGTKRHQGRF